jgi:hypothetical protein
MGTFVRGAGDLRLGASRARIPSELLTNLVSYWKMDEASGQRNDSVGTNHLTDNNTVTSVAGKLSLASHFVLTNSEFLSLAYNATLEPLETTGPFTLAGWVRPNTATAGTQYIASSGGNDAGLQVFWDSSSLELGAYLSTSQIRRTGGATVVSGTFYFFTVTANGTNLILTLNNGTPVSGLTGAVTGAANNNFVLGCHNPASPSAFSNIDIDELGFWNVVLSASLQTALYNSGAGITYPF